MLSLDWLHAMVSYLLPPALWALLLACAVAVFDLAVALGERLRGLRQLRAAGQPQHALALARRRLERADLLARLPPMLGLMATIIPLGPGLAALGDEHEDPRASLVNLVDVMLVFACGLLAALTASQPSALSRPQPVEKGREIAQPEHAPGPGAGYDRVGEVFRDPVSGKLVLIEAPRTAKP